MSSMSLRRIPAVVFVAAILAFVPTVHAQRAADAITPFKIQVPNAVLTDLKQRLSQARFADELQDVEWDYGTNLAYLKRLVDYWRDKYDWRAQEKKLNELDQFKTTLDGVDVHFIHQRSKNPNAMPLLLLNGWPSSIVEYMKVIGPLTDPAAFGGRAEDSFHVVIPSMPGYGFSGKPRERGYSPERIARMWAPLMARLGYDAMSCTAATGAMSSPTAWRSTIPHMSPVSIWPAAEARRRLQRPAALPRRRSRA